MKKKFLISGTNPEGQEFKDIPWEAESLVEVSNTFYKMNPHAFLKSAREDDPIFEAQYPKKAFPDYMIEQLKKNQDEHIRDILGLKPELKFDDECGYLTKETLEIARERLRSVDAGCIRPGSLVYIEDEPKRTYANVGRFFKAK